MKTGKPDSEVRYRMQSLVQQHKLNPQAVHELGRCSHWGVTLVLDCFEAKMTRSGSKDSNDAGSSIMRNDSLYTSRILLSLIEFFKGDENWNWLFGMGEGRELGVFNSGHCILGSVQFLGDLGINASLEKYFGELNSENIMSSGGSSEKTRFMNSITSFFHALLPPQALRIDVTRKRN